MKKEDPFRFSIFILSFTPLFILVSRAISHHLGANPVEKISHFTGSWTLKFIILTLCISPIQKIMTKIFHWTWPEYTRIRRMLGWFAFFYACIHFLVYIVLDRFFDFHDIVKDIAKRPYITVGFASFLMLIPLAVTSTKKMQRKFGKNWKRLHRLIYVIAVFGVLHYAWLVKADRRWPMIYAVVLLMLFLLRIMFWLKDVKMKSPAKTI